VKPLVAAALALAGTVALAAPSPRLAATGSRSDTAATWSVGKVDASQAWPLVQGRRIPPIAVLDSGIDAAHPGLAGRVAAARDFVDATGDTSDAMWHGTAVAGVIAAGQSSVCPDCTIVSAKVLGAQGTGNDDEIARGLLWALGRGARVVNLSMTGTAEAPSLRDAIRTATRDGVVVVAAAGNGGSSQPSFPAADPNVIGVAATTPTDTVYRWSNRGPWVTVAAPGEALTTLRGGGYTTFIGTSAAAPAVAAAAAECLAVAPKLSPAAVRRILVETAAPLRGVPFGRLDVGRAVAACASA
jgi:thermitase